MSLLVKNNYDVARVRGVCARCGVRTAGAYCEGCRLRYRDRARRRDRVAYNAYMRAWKARQRC